MLPLLKLGTLALKTLSKPIAARLKQQAGIHPKFRNLIIRVAQANHRITTTMQRRIYSHATDVEIRPLNEEKAVQAAVDLMGEVFIFSLHILEMKENTVNHKEQPQHFLNYISDYLKGLKEGKTCFGRVGVAALIFEVQRSSRSEAKKEEVRRNEMEGMRKRDEELAKEVDLLKQKLAEIEQIARGRGLAGVLNFKKAEEVKPTPVA